MARTLTWNIILAVPLLLGSVISSACASEPFDAPGTVRVVCSQIEQYHLTHRRLDEQVSRTWLREFLDQLDPQRMYFLERDVERMVHFEDRLVDMTRDDDFRFARRVRSRYRKRVQAAASYAADAVYAEHDFTTDERNPLRFDDYAATPDELRERWRKRLKAELLAERLHGLRELEAQEWLAGRYRRISRQAREMSDERLCTIYLNALTAICDPNSGYFSPRFMESFIGSNYLPTYRLGLVWKYKRGQYEIQGVHPPLSHSENLVGWNLTAIRTVSGEVIDLVERHPEESIQLIMHPIMQMVNDEEIILELHHPTTYRRITTSWIRPRNRG